MSGSVDLSDWKDGITAIATVLAVVLAAWKWFFQEWLRRRQEIPSIDGDI